METNNHLMEEPNKEPYIYMCSTQGGEFACVCGRIGLQFTDFSDSDDKIIQEGIVCPVCGRKYKVTITFDVRGN